MVYPTNAFDSRLRGDQVPLGSSPTESQKKKKKIEVVAHSELLSLQLHHDQHQDLRCVRCYARRLGDSRRNAHANFESSSCPRARAETDIARDCVAVASPLSFFFTTP